MTFEAVHELVLAQTTRMAEAIAVEGDEQVLSYSELGRSACAVAAMIRQIGVKRGQPVGVLLHRDILLPAAILGTLVSGAAYLPLDPSLPSERVRDMLDQAQCRIVLTTAKLARGLPHVEAAIVELDQVLPTMSQVVSPVAKVTPDEIAYVMFTSGSTGVPKGVLSTHGGLANRLLWMRDLLGLAPSDRILHKTPLGFDVSVWELLLPFIVGARLVLARPGGHLDNDYLASTIRKRRVTVIHFVPSMLREFLASPGVADCSTLRAVICSGEALSGDVRDRCFAALAAELYNFYGPTEASIDCTYWHCSHEERGITVPIGWPIDNMRIHVLDEDLRPVPDGQEGEICIGGVGLASGYLGRPDLTSERFFDVSLSDGGRECVYRSGDLGRRRPDGAIEFVGRSDRQIKINGVRIEPAEVEAALDALPGIRRSAVRSGDGGGRDGLVAYVVSKGPVDPDMLRASLATRLPGPMLPAHFVRISNLPLTTNGKLDEDRLEAMGILAERAPLEPTASYHRPADFRREVAAAWREILHRSKIGPDENFFDVGGDSFGMLRLHGDLQRRLAVTFPVARLFQYPTIAAQAGFLAHLGRDGAGFLQA